MITTKQTELETFIRTINTLRLQNKNEWYTWTGHVWGKYVEVKAYATWLQIMRVDTIDYGGCMDIPVKEFTILIKKNKR